MRSKSKTIVCLTLTLLILGCSNSDVAKINAPNPSNTAGVAASLPGRDLEPSDQFPNLPPDPAIQQPLEVPLGFQPPLVDTAGMSPMGFEGREILVPVVRSKTTAGADTVELLGFVNPLALKSLLSEAGTLKLVRIADEASDIQVVAVEATGLALQQGNTQTKLKLFESAGFRDSSTVFDVAGKSFGGQALVGLGGANHPPAFPFGGPGMDGHANLPGMPGLQGPGAMPGTTPGQDPSGQSFHQEPLDHNDSLGQPQNFGAPGQPELPGFSGGPQAGLPQFPDSTATDAAALPSLPNVGEAPRSTILDQR
ncbi:MAG: hypothetical protein H6823_03150 [Planctomycetaceae bacterium]|nr:hypothetical protein [Planctomycetales bacterium]MCB9937216.1 hypothetical protein [Planctomycetaceae bacterium]